MYSPDMYSPDEHAPNTFDPSTFDPNVPVPDSQAYASAQNRSIIAFSCRTGTADERAIVNTWTSTGDFYVRVRGRNGAFDPNDSFDLEIRQIPGACNALSTNFDSTPISADSGDYHTLVLTNLENMQGSDQEKAILLERLNAFVARSEVMGNIVDLSQYPRFIQAVAQASQPQFAACPFAMNLTASKAKEIVNAYWDLNPNLAYLVILGNG